MDNKKKEELLERNEGKQCKRCDFRPLCFGPKEEINLTLRKGYRKF